MRRVEPLADHRLVLRNTPCPHRSHARGALQGADHWDGVLYPPGTPSRDRPPHHVRRVGTVELNASFYRWPRDATFAGRRRLSEGFQLSVTAHAA